MLNKTQVHNLLYGFYFYRGKFPPGTTSKNFAALELAKLQVDDPPLPSDKHFEKKKLALELQHQFFQLKIAIPSPLATMKQGTASVGELATWCFQNQSTLAL